MFPAELSIGADCPLSAVSVLVIGAGVNGLTTALLLRQAGARVTVLAENFAPRVTSVVAGALWEWPPAVCGTHNDPTSLTHSKNWSGASYGIFSELSGNCATGVFLRPVNFYFRKPIEQIPIEWQKMNEFSGLVDGFVRDPALIEKNGICSPGLKDAYRFIAPMVDTDLYMRWLLHEVNRAGCQVVQERIAEPLLECEEALQSRFCVEFIVNCSGLGSRELARDAVSPLRGALVRLRNNIGLSEAHCVSHENSDPEPYFVFILPRGEDHILVGGIAEENEWETDLSLDHPRVREMWRRSLEFFPELAQAEIDQAEPVRVGLRPFRPGNVRLEWESDSSIIHNYGHGGSGVTFSWGCAHEILQRIGQKCGASARVDLRESAKV